MKIKAFVVLLLACCFACAADTSEPLSGATRSTLFVTEVDHTKLVNGDTYVTANQGGTVSITTATTTLENFWISFSNDFDAYYENNVHIYNDGGYICYQEGSLQPVIFNSIIELYQTDDWPNIWYPVGYTPTGTGQYPDNLSDVWFYDSSYNCILSPNAACMFQVSNFNTVEPTIGGASESVGYQYLSGTGSISGYRSASVSNIVKTVATTDQLSDFVDKSVTNGLASTSWVNNHQWDWTEVTNKPSFVSSFAVGRNGTPYTGNVELVLTHADPDVTVTTNFSSGIKIGSLNYTHGFAELDLFNKGDPNANVDWNNAPVITDIYIPGNVSAFNNDSGYVSASTATNIAKQIIRNAVSTVNVNLQSAEDTRTTLTNLITILKNL